MASDSPNPFFEDPHSHTDRLGTLTFKTSFVTSEEYPNTCAACSNFAKTLVNDNQSLKNGNDNYTASLEKLLQMLDAFIKEKTNRTSSAGKYKFLPSDDCEFTIHLLWQIRNVMAHNGAVIDQKCKTKYGEIFRTKGEKTHPIIELPDTLETGKEFVIHQKDFKKIQDCVFRFIKRQVTEEDYSIFVSRATWANYEIVGGFAYYPLKKGKLVFSIRKASAHGIDIDPKTGRIIHSGATFSFEDSRIHLKNGDSFPAQYIPNSEDDPKKLPDLEF